MLIRKLGGALKLYLPSQITILGPKNRGGNRCYVSYLHDTPAKRCLLRLIEAPCPKAVHGGGTGSQMTCHDKVDWVPGVAAIALCTTAPHPQPDGTAAGGSRRSEK